MINRLLLLHIFIFFMFNKLNSTFCSNIVGHKINSKLFSKKFLINNKFTELSKSSKQCLIMNKKKEVFCSDDEDKIQLYLNNHTYMKDKNLISISPGGYKGFYIMGTCHFIKENYNLSNYIFSGASAGAWNSLFMTLNKNKDPTEFVLKILDEKIQKQNSIKEMEDTIKDVLLDSYKTQDFDLKSLFIGVTSIDKMALQTSIYSDFDNLEDAIDCCIASSHIPFVTGSFTNKYHNITTFDGWFSSYPYLNIKKSILHIHPNIWKKEKNMKAPFLLSDIFECTNLFSKKYHHDFNELYENGYNDAKKNKDFLEKIFL